ncbi:4a-hydroxytetrahydrobiopterin dehydratase [Rhodohalobacter halophilus]|uniref:4a-hydroxytetrahydrobiopterin dehydratase n=1 Tax=Rhodohalobacter halophilus TaxID=1812810 RepID=UPI00083F921A|nr:4a-hydroxytetrahydrobiopterin dehydratase [Rhodohalobacter halophilus]
MEPLTKEEIESHLKELSNWSFKDDQIGKDFSFDNFKDALAFMVKVGFEAEDLGHHPNWSNVYNSVSIQLNTHDADNKVTKKDIQLAKAIDKIYKKN